MGVKKQLNERYKKQWNGCGYCLITETDGIIVGNLVTKERYFHKPTLETLRQALEHFRTQVLEMKLTRISMPRIGCGLDRLAREDVREVIQEVFKETDIELMVRSL